MKAAQFSSYGGPEVLQVNEIPTPTLKSGQVLVENHAASINAFDYKLRNGVMEKMIPLSLPVTIGTDFSGKITELGEGVDNFAIGDEVYGQAIILSGASGAIAEILATGAKSIAPKPTNISFGEAAAFPLVGVSAMQALEDHIKLQSGQRILIHGSAGGIGHIAVQLAKAIGAYVITTVSTQDIEFAKSLGADEVIDFKTQQFENTVKDLDAVFDTVGGENTDKSFQVLKKGGILVSMLPISHEDLVQKYGVTALAQQTKTDHVSLLRLTKIIESGKIKVHIAKEFPLAETQEAFTYQESSHPRGKVVIKIKV